MTSYELAYQRRANLTAVFVLLGHLPLQLAVAWSFGSSIPLALGATLLFAVGPSLLRFWLPPGHSLTAAAIGIAAMANSALLIHLGRGMIEMHFHVFVALALMVALARVSALVAAAATIAAHHLIFWFLLPRSVFNYEAGLNVVAIHAAFVVAETAVLVVIARMFQRTIAMQGSLGETIGRIASEVAMRSATVRTAGQAYATSAISQAAALAAANVTLGRIKETTGRSALNANEALTLSGAARQATDAGATQMAEMLQAMNDIKSSSGNIAKIIKTIDEIAFQTNILALNAAVEAARAGEAGAGFAVVADEVRNLAQRATQAARETAQRIDDSIRTSARGAEISDKVEHGLREVAEKSRQVNELIREIATHSQEQATGVDEVGASVARLERDTTSNARSAESTARAAVELHGLAGNLLEHVDGLMHLVGHEEETSLQPKVAHSTREAPVPVTA